jgi:hypothetical protein
MGIFAKNLDMIFDTAELCRLVYGEFDIQKRHRVAVLRALKSLARGPMPDLTRRVRLSARATNGSPRDAFKDGLPTRQVRPPLARRAGVVKRRIRNAQRRASVDAARRPIGLNPGA